MERIIRSGRYIGGEDCTSFETKLAETVGCKYCIGVSNGLDALKLIIEGYKALGIFHAGDEIIAPANTYVASILAISEAGLVPVLVEPDIDTMNVSDADAAKYIKIFTDLTQDEIAALEQQQAADPGQRPLQKRLAKEITTMVHSAQDRGRR